MDGARPVRAARGTTLTARSWQTEAPLRMLMNNLDPEVAERPDDLVVYGGTGKAARDWRSFDAIVRTLRPSRPTRRCSCSPAGRWASCAPTSGRRGCSSPTPTSSRDWATWPEFRRLEHLGLTMYGQMTAGSWIYIGTQGILQGTYETFAAVAAKRFGGTLAGTLTLTGGCGGMGGAQPLAVTMNDGVVPRRRRRRAPACDRRVEHRYLDEVADDLDDAVARWPGRQGDTGALSASASSATPPPCSPSCCGAASRSTSSPTRPARTTRCRTCPRAIDVADWHDYAERKPEEFTDRARESMAKHVEAMVGFHGRRAPRSSTTATRSATRPSSAATTGRSTSPASCPPTSGRCSARARARSAGRRSPATRRTSHATDRAVLDLFPDNDHLHRWIARRPREGRVPGPAGPDLLARLRRARPRRPGVQRDGRLRRAQRPDRHRPRPPRLRLRRQPVPRDRGHGSTAPTRSPTGRCSTRWSTPRPAPPGCRSTTAAASASAARSTPARSRSPTARRSPRRSSRACSPTTPAWASSGTSTRATTAPTRSREERGVRVPMREDAVSR